MFSRLQHFVQKKQISVDIHNQQNFASKKKMTTMKTFLSFGNPIYCQCNQMGIKLFPIYWPRSQDTIKDNCIVLTARLYCHRGPDWINPITIGREENGGQQGNGKWILTNTQLHKYLKTNTQIQLHKYIKTNTQIE